jgi:hypothetical protein
MVRIEPSIIQSAIRHSGIQGGLANHPEPGEEKNHNSFQIIDLN